MSLTYPQAIGPYSACRRVGDMVFVSGQLPLDPATGNFVAGDVAELTRQCLRNIQTILAEQGLTLDNVVKTTIFVTNLDDFATVNAAYGEFFKQPYPARSTIQVAALPKQAVVEIEAIAVAA